MPTPQITPLPEAPNRRDAPSTFAARADAWVAALGTFATQVNDMATWIADQIALALSYRDAASTSATNASTSAANAAASAQTAVAAAGVEKWISGDSYITGELAWSPADLQTYRANIDHTGITTDPSLDPTRWTGVTADPLKLNAKVDSARRRALAIAANS